MGLLDRLPWRGSDDEPADPDEQYFAELDEEFPLDEVRAELAEEDAADPLEGVAEIIREAVREKHAADAFEPEPLPDRDVAEALRDRDDPLPAEEDPIWPRTKASRRRERWG